MPSRTNRTRAAFTLTAWAGEGCLWMSQVSRVEASRQLRRAMSDDRCTRVSVRIGDRYPVIATRASTKTGGYRGPDGTIHQWTTTGVGIEGVARSEDMFAGPDFAEGWGYADADYAAKCEVAKAEALAELSSTAKGRKLLASWGVAA